MGKLAYLCRSVGARLRGGRMACPNCGGTESHVVDRKYLVTQLERCHACRMMYRTPTDDPAANALFYESEYSQGFTTDMPSEDALGEMKRTGFRGTDKDFGYYIRVLKDLGLGDGAAVFDFGCSWGYGSHQLAQAGFRVSAYEVARGRSRYARERLGVRTVEEMGAAAASQAGRYDCFFSAHVLEHVPSPAQAFAHAWELLRDGGLFVSFTPNGSEARRSASREWSRLWGMVHPNYIDEVFLDWSFRGSPRAAGSSPVTNAALPDAPEMKRLDALDRGELFFAARKSGPSWQA